MTTSHREWQRRRRWISHQFLGNSVSNVLLHVAAGDEPGSILEPAEWGEKLGEWVIGLENCLELILKGANALSPARFLESDSWPRLSSDERQRIGTVLEDDWWRSTQMATLIGKAETCVRAAIQSCAEVENALEHQGVKSGSFRERLGVLLGEVRDLRTALKDLDVDVVWKSDKNGS